MLSSFAESPHTPQFFFFFPPFLFSFFFPYSFFFCTATFSLVYIYECAYSFFFILSAYASDVLYDAAQAAGKQNTAKKEKERKEKEELETKMHKCRTLRENATDTRTMLEPPRFDFFFYGDHLRNLQCADGASSRLFTFSLFFFSSSLLKKQ